MKISLRQLERKDNKPLSDLIRGVMREFRIDLPGTVYYDPTTDHLFELFETPGSQYWILEENGFIAGGCGIYPTKGLPEDCTELVKFYIRAESRGKGYGKELIKKCLDSALEYGYNKIYLESLPELKNALGIYEKSGFRKLEKPLGYSGHNACSVWMVRDLV